jgi:hypothetical protein
MAASVLTGAGAGAAMALTSGTTQVLLLVVPIGLFILLRAIAPSTSVMLTPSRLYLPVLAAYTGISLLIVHPRTADQQLIALLLFSASFYVADWTTRIFVGRRPASGFGSEFELTVGSRQLAVLEILGVVLLGMTFAQHGVPILSQNVAAVRVKLADTATLFVAGIAALQICLLVYLLRMASRLKIADRRRVRPVAHILFITVLLIATAGRSDVLIPYALFGLVLLLGRRRPLVPMALAVVLAIGFFSAAGLFRAGSTDGGVIAPVSGYLNATSRVTDRLILGEEEGRWSDSSPEFLWIPNRFLGNGGLPPGIELREAFGLEYEGFGAEMGMIGALWFDMGLGGAPIGGLIFGALAGAAYAKWLQRGGWWTLGYAYVLIWLLLTVTQHPLASYWYVLFPLLLWIFGSANSRRDRREKVEGRSPLRPVAIPPLTERL